MWRAVAGTGFLLARAGTGLADGLEARTFDLELTVTLSEPLRAGDRVGLWLPAPQESGEQTARLLRADSPWPFRVTVDREFSNRVLYVEGAARGRPETLRYVWRVTRSPADVLHTTRANGSPDDGPGELYLKPRGLLQVNDEIRSVAAAAIRGTTSTLDEARALYEFVLAGMTYTKTGSGWGRGDSVWVCDARRGNCTDFHSLFMAMAMAAGIPARFTIGFPVPRAGSGELIGYHCWAEFHLRGRGWVPVDLTEAWKHPERRAFYFGGLDPDRVALSRGRDVLLEPAPAAGRLNWFLDPYAESNGKPINTLRAAWRFVARAPAAGQGGV